MNFHNKYWIVLSTGTVIFLYLKDVFTGLKWSEKLVKPKDMVIGRNTELAAMSKTYPLISEQEKSGYILLTRLCLSSQRQNELIAFFEKLEDFSQDEDYMTTLNYVMEYSDKQDLFFIMALDWKQDLETLEWRLTNSLNKNFNLDIDLPNLENYDKRITVSFDNVFEDYDKSLRNIGMQIGFIDTQSDEYVIFVHKTVDRGRVEKAVNKIGYKYFEK